MHPESHDHMFFMEMKSILVNGKSPNDQVIEADGTIKLRLLNSGSPVPLIVNIDNHTLTVVAKDGKDVVPTDFGSVMILTGERLDVLVKW